MSKRGRAGAGFGSGTTPSGSVRSEYSDVSALAASIEAVRVDDSDAESTRAHVSDSSPGSTLGSPSDVSDSETASVKSGDSGRSSSAPLASAAAPANLDNPKGTAGANQPVMTNYFKINKVPKFRLYGYRVDFEPPEDDTRLKRALMAQHRPKLGNFTFDGHMLYSANIFDKQAENLKSINPINREEYVVQIRKVAELDPKVNVKECMQFYNIVMRSMLEKIGLEQIGRHYYNRHKKIEMRNDHLELWPGFITAIRDHEAGTLLCVEVTHKVLRKQTAFDVMSEVGKTLRGKSVAETNEEVRKQLKESIVLTHYNRRTYRIDDIDFDLSPRSKFKKEDGSEISYADYYRDKWNITLSESDLNQPMLVSLPRRKDINKGVTDNIYLVPSLCNMTGLTDGMRKNFDLMKRLSVHLHMSPHDRKKKLDEFMKAFQEPEVKSELDNWNVQFDTEFVPATARVLKREQISMTNPNGAQEWYVPDKSQDWTCHFRNAGLLQPVNILKWIMYVPNSEQIAPIQELVLSMQSVGKKLGTRLDKELEIVRYDARVRFNESEFMQAVNKHKNGLQLVFYMLPNNALPRYAAVKRACTLKMGTVSQCFLSKNLKNKNLNSICQKMLIQMNAKLCGEPWAVKIPAKKMMVLGFDVYHCPDRKGDSVGALVATINQNCTKYFSTTTFHKDKTELSVNLQKDVIKSLDAYLVVNKELPTKIVLFRDGVGEGQIEHVKSFEVEQVKEAIKTFYRAHDQSDKDVKLAFIIVTKKINTRYLVEERAGKWTNPIPGTVLDRSVTLPERYDFFLVSQTVRQGTVSPVNYHVVDDSSTLTADHLQQLAYKLCHLYFNWSGTVAVPAPCQYAHKLAYITGMALADCAPEELAHNLWYL